jgi:hypothetical protein
LKQFNVARKRAVGNLVRIRVPMLIKLNDWCPTVFGSKECSPDEESVCQTVDTVDRQLSPVHTAAPWASVGVLDANLPRIDDQPLVAETF